MGFLCESAGQAISSTFFLGADLGESVRLPPGRGNEAGENRKEPSTLLQPPA